MSERKPRASSPPEQPPIPPNAAARERIRERAEHYAEQLSIVERSIAAALLELRELTGREPSAGDIGARLGLRPGEVTARLARVHAAAPTRLTEPQARCLAAVRDLESSLGRCPSTREVAHAVGSSQSTIRFHITRLVRLGLLTPPRTVLVLGITPAGSALLEQRAATTTKPTKG